MNKVLIKGDFLPLPFRILGGIFFIFPILSIENTSGLLSLGLISAGLALISSRFGTSINTSDKSIKKFFSVLFLRFGKVKKYEFLTCFWLKAHRMQAVWQNQAVKYVSPAYGVFDVYLVTSDGENYYLFEEKSKQAVYKKLAKAMKMLNLKCQDKND